MPLTLYRESCMGLARELQILKIVKLRERDQREGAIIKRNVGDDSGILHSILQSWQYPRKKKRPRTLASKAGLGF
jgi:hypothetical protein